MASSGGISDQLFVSVKLESPHLAELDLAPHLFGSHPVAGSWDPCKALPLERAATAVWEFSCVVPSQHGKLVDLIVKFNNFAGPQRSLFLHSEDFISVVIILSSCSVFLLESLDFKFVLKRKGDNPQYIIEEGPNRPLGCQRNEFEMGNALFKLNEGKEVLECKVQVETEMLSPIDLAASWRAHQEYFQPSRVRGTHDVTINPGLEGRAKNGFASGLELDLDKYVVPTPNMGSGVVYAASLTENPRSLLQTGSSSNNDTTKDILHNSTKGDSSLNHYVNTMKHLNPSKLVTSFFVTISDSCLQQGMPAAEGAVAAAAVADQMYGPKEDRKLAIVLVGLPARGKTFTAAKLTRYLRWLGHETKHFNVGKYRRLKHGTNQTADFFRGDNREGVEARNEVAALAMEDMLSWMQEGGQVGIFDATNSTRIRRNMLMKMAEGKCKIIFLETLCNDQDVLERNIRLKVQQSPDYAEQTDFEAGVQDFKERLTYYEKVYEPVEEGSYIKMIDMVSGKGGQLKINDISGYLPGRIVFFLVNCHLTPRPILLTRHGESMDNVRGRIGGDSSLSEAGELYSRKLASFVEKRLKSERTASIWTSTLQRTILTAHPIIGFPKIQWRALDEINAGVCDGMTYDEIKKSKPEEYESRRKDKLRYRYPRGESYLDVIQRLEPVIIELERQRAPVVVIAHQAVLRALYAYFADKPLEEVPNIEIPLHTIIEIQMGVAGVQEKRYKLMDAIHPTAGL
ncbi:6-phosphofructo-2-kinase/fructose-26-bisphosphatase [Zea mays]|uniref:6-phosphofructo-2-kinase/fructose-26-bisphosphatase n=1 Tax=Zea mays TaxID=4577 RepID=A0A1D6JZF9_MAIZE|nr:6-phosphofructo-2-kinase/fructose-26-bisphosphatase [Zea mays]